MAMTPREKQLVRETIANSLRKKFRTYRPKKKVMPFHTRLLGNDRVALFSFIQSLNTTFGTDIYEPVAVAMAGKKFAHVARGVKSRGVISEGAQDAINEIKNGLERSEFDPDQRAEMEKIRKVCQKGKAVKIKLRQADVYLKTKDNWHYPIDIKTAKPNIDGFEKYKENMLKWTASILHEDKSAKVGAMLAIPYNPDEPGPYKHWTIRGMIERETQIKVAEEFWDFLAGKHVYENMLQCFEEVGIEMRQEIDDYFARFCSFKHICPHQGGKK